MSFSPDVKACMKDCMLAVIWPRNSILQFFDQHGCTTKELCEVLAYKKNKISRSALIDKVFAQLDERADGGDGPYDAMLQSLLKWSHFEPYYYDMHKLNRRLADEVLLRLQQLQQIRGEDINEEGHQSSEGRL